MQNQIWRSFQFFLQGCIVFKEFDSLYSLKMPTLHSHWILYSVQCTMLYVRFRTFIEFCREILHIYGLSVWICRAEKKKKEEGDRSKGKGRRISCLGGQIRSIPCRANCFASVDLEETVELILFFPYSERQANYFLIDAFRTFWRQNFKWSQEKRKLKQNISYSRWAPGGFNPYGRIQDNISFCLRVTHCR